MKADKSDIQMVVNGLAQFIYDQNCSVGWWDDSTRHGGSIPDKYMVPAKIALMHSELSEALEGNRKQLMDDHLTHREMEEVEYADAIIRILDVCGHKGYDIGGAIFEKVEYNRTRQDHQRETRQATGGKAI